MSSLLEGLYDHKLPISYIPSIWTCCETYLKPTWLLSSAEMSASIIRSCHSQLRVLNASSLLRGQLKTSLHDIIDRGIEAVASCRDIAQYDERGAETYFMSMGIPHSPNTIGTSPSCSRALVTRVAICFA